MDRADESPTDRSSRRAALVTLVATAACMLALLVAFAMPERYETARPVAEAGCERFGPDFMPVRLRGPGGSTRTVCALLGVLGRD